MEENKKVDWVNWLILILGLIFLAIVGWYGLIFARSYVSLRADSVVLAEDSSDLSVYMSENGWLENMSDIGIFQGVVLSVGKCMRVWDGDLLRCFEWSDGTLGLIYMSDVESWMGRRSVSALVEGGWIRKQEVVATNEKRIEAYVSDPEKVGINEVMRILRFGDIVRVVINVETQEVVGIVMVQRGGLI